MICTHKSKTNRHLHIYIFMICTMNKTNGWTSNINNKSKTNHDHWIRRVLIPFIILIFCGSEYEFLCVKELG